MAESTAFPWLHHLPEDEQREFFEEVSNAFGEAHLHTMPGVLVSPETYVRYLDPVIASWKATAEVHADPELKAALTSETGFNEKEFVEVERPELPRRTARAPQKLCPVNVPHPTKADSSLWCTLSAGHEGSHRSRHGHVWTDGDVRRRRGASADYEIRDEIQQYAPQEGDNDDD